MGRRTTMTRRAPAGSVVRQRWNLLWLRRGGLVLLTALVVEYFVVPQLAGARAALGQLSQVTPGFLAAGLALEVGSLLSYSALTRSVLPPPGRPGYWSVLRIDISALGLSHVVPGGGATASALRFRLLTVVGVAGSDELGATAIEGTGAAGTLVLVFGAGLVLAFPGAHDNPYFLIAGSIAAVLLAAAVAAGVLVTRGESRAVSWARSVIGRLPRADPNDAERLVESLAGRLRSLARDRRLMIRTITWASANWVLDAAALWVF